MRKKCCYSCVYFSAQQEILFRFFCHSKNVVFLTMIWFMILNMNWYEWIFQLKIRCNIFICKSWISNLVKINKTIRCVYEWETYFWNQIVCDVNFISNHRFYAINITLYLFKSRFQLVIYYIWWILIKNIAVYQLNQLYHWNLIRSAVVRS